MDFSYPLLYLGNKPEKHANVPGRYAPIVFQQGPLSAQYGGKPYADVSEKDGRYLVRLAPDIFAWPEGTKLGPQLVTRDEYDALAAKVQALEEAVAELREPSTEQTKASKGRPASASKPEPTAPEVKADAP